ncbi:MULTISPECIES: phosphonate C-P lyase system protein PhnG [Dickeya]|uniref:Protein phnG n=1 Tax=Dickeya solani D s0432-1 TaxID=1231725 RepID=A0AAV3KCM8_9GAMM|nr:MULTISPECIES: phosphonate C-P lyase system protein PhnG [Dickeya]ANE76834.1 phosphonate C-P lyase system protein PhnG [Dickeya solani IPO 2222]AUC44528.1 PhnG protein [Dickeya solani RNS 08.23.3.1.A]AUH07756.1 phosphonate C-P lyase system protein PhnG [Dickeya solani D s0432-1]AUH11779.1 phosphonate C-P lyase system protein PhnG [Dickeya solani]AYH47605.1 phosphonate C-P lyase system protein PhnG [Dickeya fangzhongdai]
MATQTARQRWLSVLAHSDPDQLRRHWQPLSLHPVWQTLRAPETGLARLQARIGATGNRFVLGDVTVTRAVVRLEDGTCGYSYVTGRNKPHAELCALIDALLQQQGTQSALYQQLIVPLAATRDELRQQRAREIASSKVDFFTLVRGDNA